jgi:alcohol dehydrogenase
MRITGAVLNELGKPRPYAESLPLTIVELELDPPGPGEILVRIQAAGICHSDLSVVNGSRPRPMPMLLGHEAAGVVEALGTGVDDLAVGDHVTMAFLPRCGECANCRTEGRLPCTPGSAANNEGTLLGAARRLHLGEENVNHHLGVSGFASRAVVNRHSVVKIGADVPPEIAAVLGCAVLTGGGAVVNAGEPREGDTIIVVGLGGVGAAALITALSLRSGDVIGVDALPEKLDFALKIGATAVYTPDEAIAAGIKGAVVVEAAGHPRAFETAVLLTAPGGRTVTVGLPAPDARSSIAPLGLTAEARTIVGSYLGSAVPSRDIPRYEELWRQGRLPLENLISSRIELGSINQAMDELAEGHGIRQIIVFPEDA